MENVLEINDANQMRSIEDGGIVYYLSRNFTTSGISKSI
jgi:phage pi2 protein 07